MSDLLCFGMGYTGLVLARRMAACGWRITGTSRTVDGAEAIGSAGFRGVVFDGLAPTAEVRAALGDATHVLVSIPPDASGDPALRLHGPDLATAPRLAWLGYLSTVGVYGDHQGGLVDELTPPAPATERGRRRLAAEADWLAFGRQAARRVEIFRLPGIYGPGRSALDSVRAGTARRIVKPGQVFNRIHVEDIATVLEVVCVSPRRSADFPAIVNVTDDAPSPPEDVIAYAAELLGLPVPPAVAFDDALLSPMTRSFYGELKRVSNRRIRQHLGVELAYPSYREGLTAILAAGG